MTFDLFWDLELSQCPDCVWCPVELLRVLWRNQRHWTHLAQPPLGVLLLMGRNLLSLIPPAPDWAALQLLRQLFPAFLPLGKPKIWQRRLPWYEKHPGTRAALYHKHYLCSGNLKGLLCCILDTLFPDKTAKIWPYRYLMKQSEHPSWQETQKIRRGKEIGEASQLWNIGKIKGGVRTWCRQV